MGQLLEDYLLIKYNDEDCETLEEGTVRKLLDSHPYKLYKKSLNYGTYKKKTNEVENGKSYLKWCVPGVGKEKNIILKYVPILHNFDNAENTPN